MSQLAEGIWPGTVISATYGEDDKRNLVVRINARIDEGPSAGRMCTYEDQVNAKSSLYIARSARAVGWQEKTLETLSSDVAAWIEKTGGKTTIEVRHVPIKKGKKYDEWVAGGQKGNPPIWDKVNSIGRGPKPLAAASTETLTDADDMMRSAVALDGGGSGQDEAPHAADAGDDIPFLTCSTTGLGEIAKVLR